MIQCVALVVYFALLCIVNGVMLAKVICILSLAALRFRLSYDGHRFVVYDRRTSQFLCRTTYYYVRGNKELRQATTLSISLETSGPLKYEDV